MIKGINANTYFILIVIYSQWSCSGSETVCKWDLQMVSPRIEIKQFTNDDCLNGRFAFKNGHPYDLEDMGNIYNLMILNANITNLPLGMLENVKSLIKFTFAWSSIEKVDALDLPTLEYLNLTMNHIETIEKDAFTRCPKLGELILKGNSLAVLPSGMLDSLQYLKHIDLSNNKLSRLPEDIFHKNPSLEIILLQSNSLEELSMGIFGNATQLRELDVSNNYLHKFVPSESPIIMRGDGTILDLSNNLLASLDLRNIRATNIIINSNYLRQVSIGEGCRELFAKNNELADISISASAATLQMLQMNHNKIANNLMSICECEQLKSIFLAHNNITNIGFCFSRTRHLKEINLSRNNISHLDYGYIAPDSLQTLDLSYNSFEVIDGDVLSLFTSLQYLFLDGNRLSDIPEDLDTHLPHLGLIGISHNRFECKKLLSLYRHWKTTNRIAVNIDEPTPKNMTNIRGIICYRENMKEINEDNVKDIEDSSLNHLNGSNNAFWKELQMLRMQLETRLEKNNLEHNPPLPEKSHLVQIPTTSPTTDATEGTERTTKSNTAESFPTEIVIDNTQQNATDCKMKNNRTILNDIFKSLSSIENKMREMGFILSGTNSSAQINEDKVNVRTFATISIILAVIVLVLGAAILWYNYHSYFYYKKLRNTNNEALRTFQTM